VAAGTTGCENELDIAKHGNLGGMDTFYKTDADAESALATVYSSWKGMHFNWFFLKNLLSDDVWSGGGSRGENADLEKLNEYNFGTDNGTVEALYTSLYSLIYNTNLILDNVAEDSDVKKRARAEAKYFRAWAHFELVTLWEIAPAIDHVLAASEYKQPAGDPANTWALIERDLSEAIESGVLRSKSGLDDKLTGIRVTKEAAQAMLGKAYVFQKKWSDAQTVLDAVINSNLYDLYEGEYGDVHRMASDNCRESILEMQVSLDANNPDGGMLDIMLGWRFEQMDISAINPVYDITTDFGWGFMSPRKSLYDAFVAREGENGYRLNQTMKTSDFLRDEINMPMRPSGQAYGNEGYFFWKYRILKSESTPGMMSFAQANNKRVMRYAEVLLLAAEAHVNGGDASKATAYVNKIRTRAKLSPLGSVTMDDVKIEKRLELCAEGCRFQDLVRWGDAATVLANQGKEVMSFNGTTANVIFTNTEYGFKAKHRVLPIPGKEIMLNENIHQIEGGW
jgi:hypothetical protein